MSISALREIIQRRLCRQAYIWVAARRRHYPRPFAVFIRDAHNSLYQMVKKRTLEARTKLQANRFPNNQACIKAQSQIPTEKKNSTLQAAAKAASTNARSSTFLSMPHGLNAIKTEHRASTKPPKSTAPTPIPQNTKPRAQTADCDQPETLKAKPICQNTEILRVQNCHSAPPAKSQNNEGAKSGGSGDCKTPPPPSPPPPAKECKEPPKRPDDCEDDEKKNRMLLYALLAALGAGGLLWWFIRRRRTAIVEDDEEDDSVCINIRRSIPASSADLPNHVPYLLIGGGTAAFSAFRAIKSNDPRAKVLMVTDELKKPYMRPPLSKELWYTAQKRDLSDDLRFKQWTGAERSLYFEPDEFFVHPTKLMGKPNGGVAVAQGFKVRSVDAERRIATLSDGYEIAYDECLIATGCAPKNLAVFENAPNSVKDKVMVYRTPEDFERLKMYADEHQSITIIGNGFTGSELACSLANYTKKKSRIYQIFPEDGNMSKVLPKYLSMWTTKKVQNSGVCVLNNASVKDVSRYNSQLKLTLSNGKTLLTDIAVVCIGCDPNTDIAGPSGLETSKRLGGFVVNSELEARRNLYVAGDASCFFDPLLGRRRVEHHDHSVVSGRLAGENMTGKNKSYTHQSMFWSDLGPDIGYEGIGLVDASLPTVGIFTLPTSSDERTDNLSEKRQEAVAVKKCSDDIDPVQCDCDNDDQYGRGVIFYIKDEKIVGVLLWNLFNRIGLARTIINQNKKFEDLNEVAKLFEIHS